jgi:hypothetical protein
VLPASVSLRVGNTPEGIRQLKRWLLRHGARLVAIEATGKWHRAVCRSLRAAEIAVAVTDPYRVRAFAKATGILAKTDRLDAKVLAMFASMMAPACREPASEVIEELQELVTARASARGMAEPGIPVDAAICTNNCRAQKKARAVVQLTIFRAISTAKAETWHISLSQTCTKG